ncbi:MAG: YraN family protein [Bacteroidota bacterium]
MAEHNLTGNLGEELAADYLKTQGYKIISRNWRFGKNEIDIIAKLGEILVIAEVKTRTSNFIEDPELSVDRKKQKFLIKAADAFVVNNNLNVEVRFDIITIIIFDDVNHQINHIVDAFYPLVR